MTKKELLLSIIIIAHNNEKNIESLINMINKQIYLFNYEIVIINNYSIDFTSTKIELLKMKEHNHISRTVYLNKYFSDAYCKNIGIDNAEGKYILFISGEDIIEPEFIKSIIDKNILTKYQEFQPLVISDYKEYNHKAVVDCDFGITSCINPLKDTLINLELFTYSQAKLYQTSLIKRFNLKFDDNYSKISSNMLFTLSYIFNLDEFFRTEYKTIISIIHDFTNNKIKIFTETFEHKYNLDELLQIFIELFNLIQNNKNRKIHSKILKSMFNQQIMFLLLKDKIKGYGSFTPKTKELLNKINIFLNKFNLLEKLNTLNLKYLNFEKYKEQFKLIPINKTSNNTKDLLNILKYLKQNKIKYAFIGENLSQDFINNMLISSLIYTGNVCIQPTYFTKKLSESKYPIYLKSACANLNKLNLEDRNFWTLKQLSQYEGSLIKLENIDSIGRIKFYQIKDIFYFNEF